MEYLRDLVSALGQVLQHGKLEAKKSALRAMGSAASAAEAAFEPYVQDLLPLLQQCMNTDKVFLPRLLSPDPCRFHQDQPVYFF